MRCTLVKRIIFYFIIFYFVKLLVRFISSENENDNFYSDEIQAIKKLQQVNNKKTTNQHLNDYLLKYNLSTSKYNVCANVTRPKSQDITWRKEVYQYQRFLFYDSFHKPLPERDAFIMKFYYDDRFPEIFIRGTISIQGFGPLPNIPEEERKNDQIWQLAWAFYRTPWWVYFWYEGFENPLLVKCYLKSAGGVDRWVQGTIFTQHSVTCHVPTIGILPTHGSLVRSSRCEPANTYVEIVYPPTAKEEDKDRIGICMASLFGEMTKQDVPYFVNWMETLHMFGVSEVNMNNGSWYFKDSIVYDVIDYYKSIGRLQLTHYPPIHMIWDHNNESDAATEVVNKITTGDCFYRNLKRYWYTLIIDMDEIPVPAYHNTYQEFLLDYFTKYPHHEDYHSLGLRGSFFYLNFTAGNPEYGEHLPILRMVNRFEMKPIEVDGVGVPKSFHNNKNVVASGHHQARATYPDKEGLRHTFLSDVEILNHRYRRECIWNIYCEDHWKATIHDDILPNKFGRKMQAKIEYVLQKIGYNMDSLN